jgi:enoyl-CoA hydratase/carnithine racemase
VLEAGARSPNRLRTHVSKLRFDIDGNVGFITLTEPPDNRLGTALNKEFREALLNVAKSDCRLLVIRSEGDHFCAGGDAVELLITSSLRLNSYSTNVARALAERLASRERNAAVYRSRSHTRAPPSHR